jgi:hypothetical protein
MGRRIGEKFYLSAGPESIAILDKEVLSVIIPSLFEVLFDREALPNGSFETFINHVRSREHGIYP